MLAELTRREWLLGCASAVTPQSSILVHEHVMVDFAGAGKIVPGRYDSDEVFRVARPKLDEIKRLGCRRMLECTPNFLGRDARLMARLSDSVGLDIWINTGLYGAGNHNYLPPFAREESPEKLARRWIAEANQGVDGIKPRFIKIGVNKGPLGPLDQKLVWAAALASIETGLTVASHTGDGRAAWEQVEIFGERKAALDKFVWVHAQSEKDHGIHERVAKAGAWVEFDGIGPKTVDWHHECVTFMAGRKLLSKTLISQDSGWYRVGEPGGGNYRGYAFIYTDFLPRLDPAWVRPLMEANPVRAFG